MKKFLKISLIIVLTEFLLSSCQNPLEEKIVFTADWESMKQVETPDWFRDAKFGIYFHWGPYSVPAYDSEWYSRNMYEEGHRARKYHEETYGPLDEFGYKDFIPMFTAEHFDADEWAALFKAAGARFAGPVAEHADGFAMWDSELTEFDAMDMGPKQDIVGAMEKAIRSQDMKFITTFHHQWLYAWYPTWDTTLGVTDPADEDLYGPVVQQEAWVMVLENPDLLPDQKFNERWHSRVIEVIDKYQPDLIYFDNKLNFIDSTYRLDFLSYYYNQAQEWGRDVVVTYKFKDLKPWAGVLDLERARMSELKEFPWLTDDSVDWGSWCNVDDPDYKSTDRLIDFLVDVVSKNGCVLLNVTPTAQGEIPEPVQERLLEMGEWLKINGEAIYDTRPWKLYGEGPTEVIEGHLSERANADNTAEDIRFTQNGNMLYAICLDLPESKDVLIRSLNAGNGIEKQNVRSVSLLGSDQELSWEFGEEGMLIHLQEMPDLEHAISFRIEVL